MYEVREPKLAVPGPFALHDMRCAVEPGEHAVYNLSDGIFYPSWKAQGEGWRLVRARGRFGRWLLRTFFKSEFT